MTETNEAQTNDFLASTCGNCGAELVGNFQSPDDSLCCDCYRYNNDDDYVETESDVYQDSSYDAAPDDPSDWGDDM